MNARNRIMAGAFALACAAGLAATDLQASAHHRDPWSHWALRAVFDAPSSDVGDPRPALEAAARLHANSRAPLYDPARVGGSAFIYPPLAALLYRPFLGSSDQFHALWLADHLLFVGIYLLLLALVGGAAGVRALEALGLALLIAADYPLLRALALNQATLFVTFALGAAWVALRAQRPALAGSFLAAGVAVKPQLVLILPLMTWHSPRLIAGTLGAGAVLLATSLIYAGWTNHTDYLTQMLPLLSRGYAFYPNQSWNGLFNRIFAPEATFSFVVAPPNPTVQRLVLGFGALTYAAALAAVWRWRSALELAPWVFGFAWLVTTVISPIAWEHHYAPSVYLFACWYLAYRDRAAPAWLLAPLAVSLVLMLGYLDVARGQPGWMVSYLLFGALIQLGALAALLDRLARAEVVSS